ncbi:hypothetical protein F4604DRAFT_2037144 [Suillus subluteus]|nr:hypothetical protein F4604DRAFT_2037144 [Suillus subluteus]
MLTQAILLKTFHLGSPGFGYLGWTSDGKTLFAGEAQIDTATLSLTHTRIISLSPIAINERILASASRSDTTVQLYNLETNKPIRAPLHLEDYVTSATFSADGKFLVTSCRDGHIYTWDLSAIVNETDPLSDIADATPKPVPKMKGAAQIPPGFFDDALREANVCDLHLLFNALIDKYVISRAFFYPNLTSHITVPLRTPRQRALSRFFSYLRRSKPYRETEPDTQSRSHSLSWTRNLVPGILRRRDGSDIQLREVKVPHTAGQPRNYHATGKKAASSSRPSKIHSTQQPNTATQSTPPSSLQPPTATASTLPVVVGTPGTMGAPHVAVAGWRAHLRRNYCTGYWNNIAIQYHCHTSQMLNSLDDLDRCAPVERALSIV